MRVDTEAIRRRLEADSHDFGCPAGEKHPDDRRPEDACQCWAETVESLLAELARMRIYRDGATRDCEDMLKKFCAEVDRAERAEGERDDALKLVANRDRLLDRAYAALERIIAHEVAHDRGDAFSATEAREALGRNPVAVDGEIYRNNIKPIRVGACICQCHDTPHGPCRCACGSGR